MPRLRFGVLIFGRAYFRGRGGEKVIIGILRYTSMDRLTESEDPARDEMLDIFTNMPLTCPIALADK